MSTVTGGNFSQMNPIAFKKATFRAQFAKLPDMPTGLNEKGATAFKTRFKEILKERGISGNITFGRDETGKFVLTGDHPDKKAVENLLNNDETLKQIAKDPAHAFDFSAEAGDDDTNGYDSAHFSEEARRMYEERAAKGQNPYASSAEDTAKVMEWMDNPHGIQAAIRENPYMELPIHTQSLSSANEKTADIKDLQYIKSDVIKELAQSRDWLENEVTAILEKAGIDTSKLSGIQFTENGGKVGMLVNQKGVSGEDRKRILSVLNSPENEQVAKVMKRYLSESNSVARDLQLATGLNDADWAEVMAGGANLADVDNEGMQALLSGDPELAAALSSLFGGSGLFANTQAMSSSDQANNAAKGLGFAINSVITGGEASIGLTKQEIADLKENLTVEVSNDGTYKVGGTSNSKFLSVIDNYISHYLSGGFGKGIQSGLLLNQALGKGDASNGLSFILNFQNGIPNGTVKYGNGEEKSLGYIG